MLRAELPRFGEVSNNRLQAWGGRAADGGCRCFSAEVALFFNVTRLTANQAGEG